MLQIAVNDNTITSVTQDNQVWLVNDVATDCDISTQPNGLISVLLNGRSYTGIIEKVDRAAKEVSVRVNGQLYRAAIKEPIDLLLKNMGLDLTAMQKAEPVKAPMPGMVLKILVTAGQKVNKGDGLIILEAMKMENLLKATATGTVKAIKAIEKTAVEKGAILLEME